MKLKIQRWVKMLLLAKLKHSQRACAYHHDDLNNAITEAMLSRDENRSRNAQLQIKIILLEQELSK